MKRSEMVNLIAQYLENEFGSISYNSSNKNNGYEQIASELLTNLESEGMRLTEAESFGSHYTIYNVVKWEPEDGPE